MYELKVLQFVLNFGKIFCLISSKTVRKKQRTVVFIRPPFFNTILALLVALFSLIGSADLYAGIEYPELGNTRSLAKQTLIIGFTFIVYFVAFIVRIYVLWKGRHFNYIVRILFQYWQKNWDLKYETSSDKLKHSRMIMYAITAAYLVKATVIFFMDQSLFATAIPHVRVIPQCEWPLQIVALLTGILNIAALVFSAIFPITIMLNLTILYGHEIYNFDMFIKDSRFFFLSKRRGELKRILKGIFKLRNCFGMMNELNVGLLLPSVCVLQLHSFSYIYYVVFQSGNNSRLVEVLKLIPPLGLLLFILYSGSVVNQEVINLSAKLKELSAHFEKRLFRKKDQEMIHHLVVGLSEWEHKQMAGGALVINMSLLCTFVHGFRVYFIFLIDAKTSNI